MTVLSAQKSKSGIGRSFLPSIRKGSMKKTFHFTLSSKLLVYFCCLGLLVYVFHLNRTIRDCASVPSNDSSLITRFTDDEWEPFNSTNPNEKWCPNATCLNSPLCTPCDRRFLLIIATARSGSTTILKMLNYLPNVRLSGENNNQLFVASRLITNLAGPDGHKILERDESDKVEGAWMRNAVPKGSMGCLMQKVLTTINTPPYDIQHSKVSMEEYDRGRILGAKLIRIQDAHWSVKDAAKFFKDNFPCSRIIVNIRSDIEGQIASHLKTFNATWTVNEEVMLKATNFLKNLTEELGPEMAYQIDMMDWSGRKEGAKGVKVLNDAIKWMGFRGCAFKEIVKENMGGDGMKRDHETDVKLGNKCVYPF